MRLLYVVSQWRAPTQTFVRREVDAARAAGHEVTVLSLKAPVELVADDPSVVFLGGRAFGAALGTAARHPVRSVRAVFRAALQSRRDTLSANVGAVAIGLAAHRFVWEVDWIHAHFAWVAASAADSLAAARQQPFSVFAHAHDIFDDEYIDRYTADKLRRAAFVAVESPAIREEVRGRFGCSPTVVRMGVPRRFVVDEIPARDTGPARIVTIGSLLPKKGHDVLLRAIARLPGARLAVAGVGPEAGSLRDLAGELGIADRVDWLGEVDEGAIPALLDSASVFCLASRPTATGDRDGVPNVLIEAMARGVPCVSTAVSGIPDLLAAGRGVVVAPEDPQQLADAIGRLSTDSTRAAAIAREAHAHIADAYLTDRNWKHLERLMRRSLVAPGTAPHDETRLEPRRRQHSYLQLRALADALREEAQVVPDGLVVDLGCGAKPYAELFGDAYLGVDLLSTHGRPDAVAWAEHLPIRSGAAAVALSTQQLEHVEDPLAVLREARRILGPDGVLLLSTHGVWPYHPDPHDYWRWTEEGLVKLVGAAGFAVERVHRQGGPATAGAALLLFPLGAVRRRHRLLAPVAGAVIASANTVAGGLDRAIARATTRHLASASYLVVARRAELD